MPSTSTSTAELSTSTSTTARAEPEPTRAVAKGDQLRLDLASADQSLTPEKKIQILAIYDVNGATLRILRCKPKGYGFHLLIAQPISFPPKNTKPILLFSNAARSSLHLTTTLTQKRVTIGCFGGRESPVSKW